MTSLRLSVPDKIAKVASQFILTDNINSPAKLLGPRTLKGVLFRNGKARLRCQTPLFELLLGLSHGEQIDITGRCRIARPRLLCVAPSVESQSRRSLPFAHTAAARTVRHAAVHAEERAKCYALNETDQGSPRENGQVKY
ncbi:unnamed protein product [Arctogadus glacialis]